MKTVITKEQFESYESVRVSGVTNMLMITTVCEISGLKRDEVKYIIKNYSELNKKYSEVRKNES